MSTRTSSRDASTSDEENFICGCTALSLAALQRRIADNPALAFEQLIAETGAGTKCTACLLDLEYHFVGAQRAPGTGPAVKDSEEASSYDQPSFRHRIYRWLDRISPLVPYPFKNTVPVIVGPGIEQWIWITNRSMMFEGQNCAPEMRIELIIRDAQGRVVATEKRNVTPETTWRCLVSEPLGKASGAPAAGQLVTGSVEILRKGASAGIRGTTRPQIEIVTQKAACAVHGQAMAGAGQGWFGCLYRPDDERVFLSLLNGVDSEAVIEVSYPIGFPGVEPIVHQVKLQPLGSVLHEVSLPHDVAEKVGDKAISLRWRAKSSHKVWVICSNAALDRFSIDHL